MHLSAALLLLSACVAAILARSEPIECRDGYNNCPQLTGYCATNTRVQEGCPMSCGLCPTTTTTTTTTPAPKPKPKPKKKKDCGFLWVGCWFNSWGKGKEADLPTLEI